MNMLAFILIVPLLAALFSALFIKSLFKQRLVSVISTFALLILSCALLLENNTRGIVVLNTGSWASEFGIVLVADSLSSIMLVVSNFTALCVLVYSFKEIPQKVQKRYYYSLFSLLLLGVNGSFITGDIFNLYVWFEVMLLSSFILLTIGRQAKQLEGAIKYVIINLFSSFLFLMGIGLLYAKVGTLNLADIALKLSLTENAEMLNTTGVVLLVSFAFKAALFPFCFWLPASYHTPPTAISALFSGLLTKVGVYALIRIFGLLFLSLESPFVPIFAGLGLLTMVIGALCAASQFEIRKILSVHIVSQIGYMIIGLAIFTPLAIAGCIFYILHNILVKTNLFLISGIIERIKGTVDLAKIGGLYKSHSFLAILFCLSAFSLAGLPPLSGFWAKLSILKAAAESEKYFYLFTALAVSVVTLYSMTKIWAESFWKRQDDSIVLKECKASSMKTMYAASICMTVAALLIGLSGNAVFELCLKASEQILDPSIYINAVKTGGI